MLTLASCSGSRVPYAIPLQTPPNDNSKFNSIPRQEISFEIVSENVLKKSCISCHSVAGKNKGNVNLESYTEAAKYLNEIEDQLLNRKMPPSQTLSEAQILLVIDWIRCGAKEKTDKDPCRKIQPPPPAPAPVPVPVPIPAPTPPASGVVNFEKVFNAVIKAHCLKCHSDTTVNKGEVNLDTYQNTFDQRNIIKEVISDNYMPPKRESQLTAEQKKLIVDWIDAGAPEK